MKLIILVFLGALLGVQPVFAQVSALSLQERKLDGITKKIERNRKRITQKKRQKKRAERKIGAIGRELRQVGVQLGQSRNRLSETAVMKRQTQKKIKRLEKDVAEATVLLENRVVAVYKNRDPGVLAFLFSPRDSAINVDAAYYGSRMIRQDFDLIQDLEEKRAALLDERKRLERQSRRFIRLQNDIRVKERKLKRDKAKQRSLVSSLGRQIGAIERRNRDLQRSSKQITALINRTKSGKYLGTGRFIKPVRGWISSRFGNRRHPIFKRRRMHNGLDIAAPRGRKIKAADSGRVLYAGQGTAYRGYGRVTVIDHGRRPSDGKRISTVYAHQSRILVRENDIVQKGDEIGWVGQTGYATGPHLHFEVREDGVPVNPMSYLKIR